MVELIIQETGFPMNRETLTEFQESFQKPIQELLNRLPGNRVLSGFEVEHQGGSNWTLSEGVLLHRGKLWTVEPYAASTLPIGWQISFFETVVDMTFNVGTQANPSYADRPGKIVRTAQVGDHAGRTHIAPFSSFMRGRKQLEYLKSGSIFIGQLVHNIGATTYHVDFGYGIGTKDYQVLGNFRAADPANNFNIAFVWEINNRTATGFDVIINNSVQSSVPLMFDYTVIPITREAYMEQQI